MSEILLLLLVRSIPGKLAAQIKRKGGTGDIGWNRAGSRPRLFPLPASPAHSELNRIPFLIPAVAGLVPPFQIQPRTPGIYMRIELFLLFGVKIRDRGREEGRPPLRERIVGSVA